jgi:hypothetical protein
MLRSSQEYGTCAEKSCTDNPPLLKTFEDWIQGRSSQKWPSTQSWHLLRNWGLMFSLWIWRLDCPKGIWVRLILSLLWAAHFIEAAIIARFIFFCFLWSLLRVSPSFKCDESRLTWKQLIISGHILGPEPSWQIAEAWRFWCRCFFSASKTGKTTNPDFQAFFMLMFLTATQPRRSLCHKLILHDATAAHCSFFKVYIPVEFYSNQSRPSIMLVRSAKLGLWYLYGSRTWFL